MTALSRSLIVTCCFLILTGCARNVGPQWRHFQGDLAGQGYLPVESGFALSSAWIAGPYNITSSSPVIGTDINGKEIVYIGTVDGELVAIDSESGNERWRLSFASGDEIVHIVSAPAVSRNGHIYVITHQPSAGRWSQSVLHKVDEFSKIRWSLDFVDNGFTTGSPKVLQWGEDTLIFAYVTVVVDDDPQGALLVLRDNGKTVDLIDRKALGHCKWGSAEQRANSKDVLESYSTVEEFISANPAETVVGELPDVFIDPSPALFTNGKLPLIAIADNLCNIGVYEWDDELSVVWREFHPFEKHSSSALLPDGIMVFGRRDGKILAYDMVTGVKLWEYDAGRPVFATPAAAAEENVFIIAKDHFEVLRQLDGTPIYDGDLPRKFALTGQTYASPAVSENCIYVSTRSMLTLSLDMSTRSQDTNFSGNGLASIALANSGAVYAVAADGTIHKYLGPK